MIQSFYAADCNRLRIFKLADQLSSRAGEQFQDLDADSEIAMRQIDATSPNEQSAPSLSEHRGKPKIPADLRSLPGEVRNIIYEYVLDDKMPGFRRSGYHANVLTSPTFCVNMDHPLLREKGDLQEEVLTIGWRHITFRCEVLLNYRGVTRVPAVPTLTATHVIEMEVDVARGTTCDEHEATRLLTFLKCFKKVETMRIAMRGPEGGFETDWVKRAAKEFKSLGNLKSLSINVSYDSNSSGKVAKGWTRDEHGTWAHWIHEQQWSQTASGKSYLAGPRRKVALDLTFGA